MYIQFNTDIVIKQLMFYLELFLSAFYAQNKCKVFQPEMKE